MKKHSSEKMGNCVLFKIIIERGENEQKMGCKIAQKKEEGCKIAQLAKR